MIDMHIHSLFSDDSEELPLRIAERASAMGLRHIAVTDHSDFGYPDHSIPFVTDYNMYFQVWEEARDAVPGIPLSIGIELGYSPNAIDVYTNLLASYPFEYVVNSVHVVDGEECYHPPFFEGKTREAAYTRYLELVSESIDAPYYYNTIGHLGYICRNAPYPNPAFSNEEYALIDEILSKIIVRKKILEINSSVRTAGSPILPTEAVLARYKELGGELITFGSDAHSASKINSGYETAADIAKAVGFKYFAVVKSRRVEMIPIE